MASTVFQLSLRVIVFTLTFAITLPKCADQRPCSATTCRPGKERLVAETTVTPCPDHESETNEVTSESTSTATCFNDKDTPEIDLGAVVTHYPSEYLTKVDRLLAELFAGTSTPATEDSQPTTEAQSQPHSGHGQTPATAVLPTSSHQTPQPDGDAVTHLWRLCVEQKDQRLIEAAKKGAVGNVEELLAAGANLEVRDVSGMTALNWAAAKGHVETVRHLLGAGAEVDAQNSKEVTPLHFAAHQGHAVVVQLLLASSADPNARQEKQWTPLHYAAWYGHTPVVQFLVASQADIEARSGDSLTPLHYAAYTGHAETAAALLKAGADRAARIKQGHTPLDLARQEKHQQVIDLLT